MHLDSTEILTQSLAHHVKIDKVKPQSTTKITPFDDDEEIDVVTPTVDPFLDLNASEINNRGKSILDYASDSSSDDDNLTTTLANTWRSHELDNSDIESVDSDEDPLKHAGVYTVDEVVTISKEKMQHLQALYIDQFQRLQHVLREKRRQYLQDIKKEKDIYSNIHDQFKDSPRERKLYSNLKAMNHYHRRHGTEALLHRQFMEKRQKQLEPALMAAPVVPQKNIPKCIFSEGGVKCNERSIPCCRFCRKHIMEDKKQILFKACGVEKSGIICQEPVQNIFDDSACVLHTTMPHPKVYIKRKYESETEEEEESQVKKEMLEDDSFADESTQEMKIEPTSTDEVIVE
jgi:KAT8 regulatory NSL complex subunit 2